MEKEDYIKKLTLILEDFDSNREADMQYYIDDICTTAEMYFAEVIKEERAKAIKGFLLEQLRNR